MSAVNFASIIDYGAIPDINNPSQRTANAAAIMAAAAASPAILIPGQFWTDPVLMPNTVRVMSGMDRSNCALLGVTYLPTTGAVVGFDHGNNPLTLERLSFLAPVDGVNQTRGLQLKAVADGRLNGIRAEGWMGFEIVSCNVVTFNDLLVSAWSNTAVNTVGCYGAKFYNPRIKPAFNSASSVALGLTGCGGSTIIGGDINAPGVFGIYGNSIDNTTIMGVTITPGLRESINIGSVDNGPASFNFTISGCVLRYSPSSIDFGICLAPGANSFVSQAMIENCIIDSPGASGISLVTAPNSAITGVGIRGNRIINPAHNIGGDPNFRCGIQAFAGAVTRNVIEGNLITDAVGQMGWAINTSSQNFNGANYGTGGSLGFQHIV